MVSESSHSDESYVIDGDRVYIDDEKAYIEAYPHTLHTSGWVYFNLTSKIYEGDIDVVWGFNTSQAKPAEAELYNPKLVHEEKSYTCSLPNWFNYTTNPKHVWCWFNETSYDNETNETILTPVLVFEHDFESANLSARTIYWTETRTQEWQDISDAFNSIQYEYDGKNVWYYKKGFSVTANKNYQVRMWLDVPICLSWDESCDNYGKFDFAVKPSDESISQAISNNHFYFLDPWWNTSWNACRNVTADSGMIGETHTNFPGLLILDSDNIDYAKTQNSGEDLRVVSAACGNGGSVVPYEIEQWNESGKSFVWFKYDSLAHDSDTVYSIYYDNDGASDGQNATGVWDQYFVGVWHMADDESTNFTDSTTNAITCTKASANNPPEVQGTIGLAQDFDGSSDYADCGNGAAVQLSGNITLEAWGDLPGGLTDDWCAISKISTSTWLGYQLWESGVSSNNGDMFINAVRASSSVDNGGDLHYLAGTYGHPNVKIYQNTILRDTDTGGSGLTDSGQNLVIGARSNGYAQNWNGYIEEVRISTTERSANWINTTYNFITDIILTYAAEQSGSSDTTAPTISVDSPTNTTYSTTLDLNITANENAVWCGYNLDGGSNTTLSNDSMTNWFIEVTPASDGLKQLIVYCNDTSGNMGMNDTIWFTYDGTAPTVEATEMYPGSPSTTSDLELNVTCTDSVDSSMEVYWIIWKNETEQTALEGSGSVSNNTETLVYTILSGNTTKQESWWAEVWCDDSYRNSSHSNTTHRYISNTAPTQPSLDSPADGGRGNEFNMSWSASTDADGDGITYWIRVNNTIYTTTDLYYDATSLSDGGYNWNVTADDGTANGTVSSTRYYTLDKTAPSITIVSPTNSSYNDTVNINVTTNEDADSCLFNLDGGSNTTVSNDSMTNWFSTNQSALTDGTTYNIIIYCNDTVGNMGMNDTIWFTYDNSTILDFVSPTPANATEYEGKQTIIINVSSDENLNECELNWRGETYAMTRTGSYCEYTVSKAMQAYNQWLLFYVTANESGGNTNTTSTRYIKIHKAADSDSGTSGGSGGSYVNKTFYVGESGFSHSLIPLAEYRDKVTLTSGCSQTLRLNFECVEDDSCSWAMFPEDISTNTDIVIGKEEEIIVFVDVKIPDDPPSSQVKFNIVVSNSEDDIKIPYVMKIPHNVNWVESLLINISEKLVGFRYEFPNENMPVANGFTVLWIAGTFIAVGILIAFFNRLRKNKKPIRQKHVNY